MSYRYILILNNKMINKINNCKNRAIVSSFNNIEEVVNFIKSPPQEIAIQYVENARNLKKI